MLGSVGAGAAAGGLGAYVASDEEDATRNAILGALLGGGLGYGANRGANALDNSITNRMIRQGGSISTAGGRTYDNVGNVITPAGTGLGDKILKALTSPTGAAGIAGAAGAGMGAATREYE